MRKFEISIPEELLPKVTRAVHGHDLKLVVKPSDMEDEVIISVPYEKDQEEAIEEVETEIEELTDEYYSDEKE